MRKVYHSAAQLPLFALSKICPHCNPPTEKPLEEFPIDREKKDGRKGICKTCYSATLRGRKRNKQKPDKEKSHQHCAKYYRKNRERLVERERIRRAEHHEEILALKHIDYQSHIQERRQTSKTWQKAHPLYKRQYRAKRRMRENASAVGNVDYQKILERDGYWCYICEQNIDPDIRSGVASLTFDHVKPLAGIGERRGTHTEDNIKPAHKCCNSRKHLRLLEEMTPFQRRGV